MDYSLSLQLAAPEILLSLASLILLLIAAWGKRSASQITSILTVLALAAASFITVQILCGGTQGEAFYGQYIADSFSSFTKLLIFGSAAPVILMAGGFFDRNSHGGVSAMRPEFPILVLFASIGMGLMVSANDFLTLYIGLELNSLAAYVLASFQRNDERSAEAGLKYFVLGALASGILLFGMSIIYGFTGGTGFEHVANSFKGGVGIGALFGIIFVFAGLAFKISAVPFHMWTPDVYEGAPTPVTAFFATAPKVAAIALLMRVTLSAFGGQLEIWQQIVTFIALASIIVGAAGAIGQKNIKRLLAYSSINNVGFILVGLAAGTQMGAAAMLTYLAIYVIMTLGSFAAIMELRNAQGEQVEDIASIAGLSSRRPGLALALAIFMFSLAGIPPLFGFWGKFVVFYAAVDAGLIILAALAIAASVIGAFYYLKIVKIMYFDDDAGVIMERSSLINVVIMALCALLVSPIGYLFTKFLDGLANLAARALF